MSERTFAGIDLGCLDSVVLTLNHFPKAMTRRRRRRLRGGKTQPASLRPTFRPWIPTGPMVVARGASLFWNEGSHGQA